MMNNFSDTSQGTQEEEYESSASQASSQRTETSQQYIVEYLKSYDKDILRLGKQIVGLKGNITKAEKKTEKTIDELRRDKLRLIEVIGVFVAIFTFISVEVQVLKYADSFLSIAGLSLIFFSGLILFVLLIFILTERWINHSETLKIPTSWWLLFSATFLFLLGGIGCISYENAMNSPIKEKTNELNNEIKALKEQNEELLRSQSILNERVNDILLNKN